MLQQGKSQVNWKRGKPREMPNSLAYLEPRNNQERKTKPGMWPLKALCGAVAQRQGPPPAPLPALPRDYKAMAGKNQHQSQKTNPNKSPPGNNGLSGVIYWACSPRPSFTEQSQSSGFPQRAAALRLPRTKPRGAGQ